MIKKLPWEEGYDNVDISNAIEMPMNLEHGKISYGQEIPGYFRTELINKNIFSTFEAIKRGLRTATSRTKKYKKGQIFLFTNNKTSEKLLCIATCDSYSVKDISELEWSKLEGWNENYIKSNPSVLNKFQFKFNYIKSL